LGSPREMGEARGGGGNISKKVGGNGFDARLGCALKFSQGSDYRCHTVVKKRREEVWVGLGKFVKYFSVRREQGCEKKKVASFDFKESRQLLHYWNFCASLEGKGSRAR